jgi:hypothetical protein
VWGQDIAWSDLNAENCNLGIRLGRAGALWPQPVMEKRTPQTLFAIYGCETVGILWRGPLIDEFL